MNKMSKEYSGSSVGCNSCYANLGCYYGPGSAVAKVASGTTSGVYLTPDYAAPGYDTLTHGDTVPGCSSYFNIVNAYGAGAANCSTSYTTRLCGAGCGGAPPPVENYRQPRRVPRRQQRRR